MANFSKLKDIFTAIDTSCDFTQEPQYDQQSVLYSSNGSKVQRIGDQVEKCVISDGVTTICDNATSIEDCPMLTDIKLPESLISIGKRAFLLQQYIETMNIPRSLEVVKDEAFYQSNFKELPANNSIKYFGCFSFADCVLDGDLKIKSAIYIDKFAFNDTKITSVEFSDSIDVIGELAFAACEKLESITIPKSVKHIGGGALSGCNNLKHIELLCDGYIVEDGVLYSSDKKNIVSVINAEGKFYVQNGVEMICNGAFYNSHITSIVLPRSVKTIGEMAFYNSQLKQITVPDNISEIGSQAFACCPNLKRVKLPKNLQIIQSDTFYDCYKLTEVKLPLTLTHIGANAFDSTKIKELSLPESLTHMGIGAFQCCYELERINIPPQISEIAEDLFYSTKLTTIIIPDSVKKIGNQAFASSCLEYIKLPNTIEYIDAEAFDNCNNINIEISSDSLIYESLKSTLDNKKYPISYKIVKERKKPRVFKAIDYLALTTPKKLTIPYGIKKIGFASLYKREQLHEVTIPSSVTTIEEKAFHSCKNIRNIVIPDSVLEIDSGALSFCENLESVKLSANIKAVPSFLFFHSPKLKNVEIPSSVEEIEAYAFAFCKEISSVSIPYGVTRIDDSVFFSCENLREITISETVKFIGFAAFGSCPNIESITIPRSVEEVEDDILYKSDIKCVNVYKDSPIKEELIVLYGDRVNILE